MIINPLKRSCDVICSILGLKKICLYPVTRPSLKTVPTLANLFFYFTKITRKTLFSQCLTIFFANQIFLQFYPQNPFWKKKKKIKKKKIRPTFPNFLGMLQETNSFFRPYTTSSGFRFHSRRLTFDWSVSLK